MTPTQRALARHALGLPNENRRSYRNRYISTGGDYYFVWTDLVSEGLAFRRDRDCFGLTLAGAKFALDPGETLYLEDFPHD